MASRQAPKATTPTRSRSMYTLCLFFLVIASPMVNTPALADQVYSSSPPSTLVLYEHQDNTPPDHDTVVVASPSGNLSSFEFGTLSVISNVLREGASKDSLVLGAVDGLVITEKNSTVSGINTIVFNTGSWSGTISLQGSVNAPGSGELAITGGTGDFRWARGYLELTTVYQDPEDIVFKLVLHIKYD